MKPDYKNWMPRGMIWGTLALSAVSFALSAAAGRQGSAWSKGGGRRSAALRRRSIGSSGLDEQAVLGLFL